jgi:hypothetical protein
MPVTAHHPRLKFLLIACVGSLISAAPAVADRIDGDWCHSSGSVVIEGPQIRTPAGNMVQGNYSHHGFSYKVPATEPEAGLDIDMRMLNDETITVSRGSKPGEIWKRCKVTS